jgi:Cu/Ag efflux pump CusA
MRSRDGRLVRLAEVADIQLTGGRYKILHHGGQRIQTSHCKRARARYPGFRERCTRRIAKDVKLSAGNYVVYSRAARAQAQAREDLIVHSVIAGIGIFLLLYIAFSICATC